MTQLADVGRVRAAVVFILVLLVASEGVRAFPEALPAGNSSGTLLPRGSTFYLAPLNSTAIDLVVTTDRPATVALRDPHGVIRHTATGLGAHFRSVGLPLGTWQLTITPSSPLPTRYSLSLTYEAREHVQSFEAEASEAVYFALEQGAGSATLFEAHLARVPTADAVADGGGRIVHFSVKDASGVASHEEFAGGEGTSPTLLAVRPTEAPGISVRRAPLDTRIPSEPSYFFRAEILNEAELRLGAADRRAPRLTTYIAWNGTLTAAFVPGSNAAFLDVGDFEGPSIIAGPLARATQATAGVDIPANVTSLLYFDATSPAAARTPTQGTVRWNNTTQAQLTHADLSRFSNTDNAGDWRFTLDNTEGMERGRPRLMAAVFPYPPLR